MKQACFLLFAFVLSAFTLHAQELEAKARGKISGRIIDSISGQPIEYASISLLTEAEGKIVNGATADVKGVFKISNVADGTYKVQIFFIGYKTGAKNNIIVSKENSELSLGDIKLANKQTTLKEVTVTSEKALIENKIDKMVYHADQDITSQTGVAADILKKIPEVSVDVNGNVELQGSSSIRFLINGKPSVLFGKNVAEVLQSIPASMIESVEVITSPGAKYDAEGTGGIINILLKKSSAQGVNGNLSLSGGTRLENGSFNLNVRKGHFGVNAFFSGNAQLLSTTLNNNHRTSQDDTSSSVLDQKGSSDFSRQGYEAGIGFDWDINPKNNISGSIGYDYAGHNNSGYNTRQGASVDASGNVFASYADVINTINTFHEGALDCELGYTKKFDKEDQELELLYTSSYGNSYSQYKIYSDDTLTSSSYGNNPGLENENNFSINYVQPVGEDATIEAGAKAELYHTKAVSDVYLLNIGSGNYDYSDTRSNTSTFDRTVYACYLSSTFKLFDALDIKMGCRDEYTVAKANFSNSGNLNIPSYNTLVPSVVLSHTFENRQTLKLSYTHRIERPDYEDLNPFLDLSDPKNITTGKPDLKTETGDKIEIGFNKSFANKVNINSTLFYRGNRNDIQPYTRYYSAYTVGNVTYYDVSITSRDNIGKEDNIGWSLFVNIPLTKKLSLRSNISLFERYITTGLPSGGDVHGFMYRTNLNAAYQMSKTLVIELFGNFNSSRINAQGTVPSFTTYNFAFRKQLFHKQASIAITATNFLNEYIDQKTEQAGTNFAISNERQLPYRSFGFNFTWKFGHLEFKEDKESEDKVDPNLMPPSKGN